MFQLRVVDRLKYYLERQLAKGALYQLLVVWVLVAIISVIGGLLVMWVREPGQTASEIIWWSFLRLSDPGYLGDDEGMWRRFISTILTVLGYVLFMGTLVAIMTQWLFRKMRTLEQGLTPVALQQHLVILGWNSRTLPIATELMSTRGGAYLDIKGKKTKPKLAILADDITLGPSAELFSNQLLYKQRRRVVMRSGSILNPVHMHRVAAGKARAVIIPSRSDFGGSLLSADAEVVKILLSLNMQEHEAGRPAVVAELQSVDKIPLALHSYHGPLQLVASDIAIARMVTQSLLHPGVAEVLNNLLVDPKGCQLHLAQPGMLQGRTWKEVDGHFEAAIPIGLVRAEEGHWVPLLNPAPETRITAQDKLVLLADHSQDIVLLPPKHKVEKALPESLKLTRKVARSGKRILVLGWNNKVPTFVHQLASFREHDFELTLVSSLAVEERQSLLVDADIRYQLQQLDYTIPGNMQKLQPASFDTVILFGSDRLQTGEEADARSIVANQLLDYLLKSSSRRPQILLELTDPNNVGFVHTAGSEVLQTSSMISHVLAQLAVYPELRAVYDELLAANGNNMILLPVPDEWFGVHSFRQLQRAVSEQGAVLLGLKEENQPLALNVEPAKVIDIAQGLQLVIMQSNLDG
ncbi:hypothetical protein CWE09_11000 [Aliidiomarina minuta]|uniref:CASTOR/POLLUX/SYM8 ion channel conserved domain-containing protein n=1 Tax=Aliidiomarina minuta TaxID=880057 RepID=A0A432W4K0_9GAMM|nr:hypothetical protein [Aliidiomarina minuta]RUO24389.1 hypothetical protein CWE09_11000 [Aliidiomarina minuta]